MQHHDVYHVDEHDYCETTQYCKRCGLSEFMIKEQMLKCRFSLNLVCISHLRREQIIAEEAAARKKAFDDMIKKIKEDLQYDG